MTTVTIEKPQHLVALEHANEIRLAHAAMKRDVRKLPRCDGMEAVAAILLDPDETAQRMRLRYLLDGIRRFQREPRQRILTATRLAGSREDRRLGELTERERRMLAAGLLQLALKSKDGKRVGV